MELKMSDVDTSVLRETLKNAISEIQSEMVHTDDFKMQEDLKERKEILKGMLGQISNIATFAA